jgi:hypothetical protein
VAPKVIASRSGSAAARASATVLPDADVWAPGLVRTGGRLVLLIVQTNDALALAGVPARAAAQSRFLLRFYNDSGSANSSSTSGFE